ncbi:hypothetical protein TNCV_574071 [Trichonephila clavipes]|nr:hypothetical protein TNCV_574071 [Trichonephila clavipes]
MVTVTDLCGRGSLMVKVTESWPECREFEPSTAEDPPLSVKLEYVKPSGRVVVYRVSKPQVQCSNPRSTQPFIPSVGR